MKYYPYAPLANLLHIITLHRESKLQEPLNAKILILLGIPSGNTSRTLHALRFLRWVDGQGSPTHMFTRLAHASSYTFPQVLAENLEDVYRDIFAAIPDLKTATPAQLEAAFVDAEPPTQHSRMISLFRGLCHQAGLLPESIIQTRKRNQAMILLAEIVEQIPIMCRWTKGHRDRWVHTFIAALDLVVEVEKEENMSP